MKKLLTTTAIAVALAASAGSAFADTSDKRIALSNNYAGNSWRQAMLRSWDKVTKPAVEQGIVAAADAFTTGRGSAFGSKPAPTIKLATNSRLYASMEEDMDINCGDIVDGDATIESKGEEIFRKMLAVASGERSKSELLGLGDNEFVPWQMGATM